MELLLVLVINISFLMSGNLLIISFFIMEVKTAEIVLFRSLLIDLLRKSSALGVHMGAASGVGLFTGRLYPLMTAEPL
jgi:hypothetical protein